MNEPKIKDEWLYNARLEVALEKKEEKKIKKRSFTSIRALQVTKSVNDHVRFKFSGTIHIPVELEDHDDRMMADRRRLEYIENYVNDISADWKIVVKLVGLEQAAVSNNHKKEEKREEQSGQPGQPKTTKEGQAKEAKEDPKENEKILFRGVVTKLEVTGSNDTYEAHIEGASYTYLLDVHKNNRSFQNASTTYSQLIHKVIGDQAVCADRDRQTASIKRLYLQYQETNWEFLKRMASRQNQALVADCIESKPKFWFRVPDQSKTEAVVLEASEYQVRKNIRDFQRNQRTKAIAEMPELNYLQIQLNKCRQLLEIGDKVSFHKQELYVQKAVTELVGGALVHHYTLGASGALKQKPRPNRAIAGIAIAGKVLKVVKDEVKVELLGFATGQDGQPAEQELWPFVYASFYTAGEHSGWYCMPEPGDRVQIYFPTTNEENAFAMGSLRVEKKGELIKIENPEIKYIRTKFEKELIMGEKEITLVCYGKDKSQKTLIRLNDGSKEVDKADKADQTDQKEKEAAKQEKSEATPTGIAITTFGGIKLQAGGALKLHSEKQVRITAGNALNLISGGSSVAMNGQIQIHGEPVELN